MPDGEILHATAQLTNETGHAISVEEFRIWPEGFEKRWAPGGELANGVDAPVSGEFDYYDDTDVRFLVKYRDLATGSYLWAEVAAELGNGNNKPIKVKARSRLRIEHGDGDNEEDWRTV